MVSWKIALASSVRASKKADRFQVMKYDQIDCKGDDQNSANSSMPEGQRVMAVGVA